MLAGMPPLPSQASLSADCFLLFLSSLALPPNEQVTFQKSVEQGTHCGLQHHSRRVKHAHVSKVAETFSRVRVQDHKRAEASLSGREDPRTPWLPSPPASTEQADSNPCRSRPPKTPCELPIARATSPSSPTSTCPTTY